MKKIKVEIPLDEAISMIGTTERTVEHIEETCERDNNFYLHTGIMISVKDRIFDAVLNQSTLDEIKSVRL